MVLAVVSAFMFCALLSGVFYMIYVYLVHYGLDPYVAGITLGAVALFVTIALVAVTVDQLRQLRDLSHFSFAQIQKRLAECWNIAGAFIDGFLDPRK